MIEKILTKLHAFSPEQLNESKGSCTPPAAAPENISPLFGTWVDVNKYRPEKMGNVLCACEGGNVDKTFYDPTAKLDKLRLGRKYIGKWGRYFELAKMGYKITHWMPLPPPPKPKPLSPEM